MITEKRPGLATKAKAAIGKPLASDDGRHVGRVGEFFAHGQARAWFQNAAELGEGQQFVGDLGQGGNQQGQVDAAVS